MVSSKTNQEGTYLQSRGETPANPRDQRLSGGSSQIGMNSGKRKVCGSFPSVQTPRVSKTSVDSYILGTDLE